MEQQASDGGLQYVPQIAVQYIYLDFDGELTSYNGEILTIDHVEVKDSSLTEERINSIVSELNSRYAAQNVIFVTSRPESIEYSTIYIGKTEAFSPYGNFAGLAENIDHGNQIKNDNAFVMLDSTSSNESIISTISHETDHLLGTLDHGGEGLNAYAVNYDIANGMNVNNVPLQENDSMYLYSGGIANGTTVGFSGYLDVASGGTANNTVVEHLGSMHISTGGVANKIITDTGGNVVIFCSGSADDVTVNHGGYLYVSSGGSAQNIKETGGYVGIEEGAAVSFVSNTISGCFSGGSVSIHSQTSAVDVSLSATAKMTVFAGGVASNTYLRGNSYYQPFLNISSGGYAKETTVSNDAWLYVSHGGFVESTLVESGNMSVLSGGTASKITISGSPQSNGMLYVYGTAGEVYADSDASVQVQALGSASGVTICQSASLSICGKVSDANIQGYAVVSDLGVLDDSDISGHLRISAGGLAKNTENHGAIYIHSGGIAQNIRNHGVMHISSLDFYSIEEGGIAQNTVNYHEMHISGGGIATDTVLDANGINIGKVYISSGGRAQNVFFKYGEVYVYAAGLADNVTLNPLCGSLTVFSGGTANIAYSPWTYGDIESRWGAVVNYLERDYSVYYGNNSSGVISKSSALNDLTVLSGNQLLIYSDGSVKNTNILTGGDMRIFGGGTANNTTVNSGGEMFINSGGTANSTTINAYGKMSIGSGGIANDTVVSGYDAVMYISSGGVASNTVLSGVRGSMYISSGGSANSITIRNSGTNGRINVSTGGIVSNIFVESNSVLVLLGSARNVLVHGVANCETACNVIVESGGTVSGNIFSAIVKSGAFSYISGANETQLYGEMIVASNGSADNTVIERSGIMYIHSSGTAAKTTVLSGGTMHVSGTANETTVSSGGYIFFSGNSAASHQDLTLLKGGIIGGCFTYTEDKHWDSFSTTSYGKGIAEDNVFVASGHISISSGGIAHNMVIHSGGVMWVNNGCVADNTIIENGSIIVAAGGTACNTIVNGSGNLNIYEKGTASGTIINSGGKLNLLSSGSAVDTVICSGGTVTFSSGGILSNTVIESGGAIVLSNGGGASQTTISSGGALTLTRHGTVSGLTVHSGASVNVIDNGWIDIWGSDTLGYASFSDWGVLDVRSGGFVHDITIGSNGYLRVANGSASAVVLNSGGSATLYTGAVLQGKSTLGGMIVMSGTATATGANLDFAVNQRKTTDGYIVNNLSLVSGAPTYTITVSANQECGTYKLAQGAENFTGSISVGNGTVSYGNLSVNGNALKYNDLSYKLTLSGGNLHLSVDRAVVPVTDSPATDIKNRGFSQVVAWDKNRGTVGMIHNDGSSPAAWGGVWEWSGSDINLWRVAGAGHFKGSKVDYDGVLLYNGIGNTFAAWTDLNDPSYGYVDLCHVEGSFNTRAIADFDGNNYDDILIFDDKGSFGTVLDGTTYKDIWHVDNPASNPWKVLGAGSFGGAADKLIVENSSNGHLYLWQNNDSTFKTWNWSQIDIGYLGKDSKFMVSGDFNGDGTDDVVIQKSNGEMWCWDDGNSANLRWIGNLDKNFAVESVGDYNADGKEDILLREQSSGWGGLGFWGAGYAGNWTDMNVRIETDTRISGSKFAIIA